VYFSLSLYLRCITLARVVKEIDTVKNRSETRMGFTQATGRSGKR